MRKFGFETEYGSTFEHGVRFLDFPEIESGTEIIEEKQIPGRAGTLSVRTGKYTDTTITNSMEFCCKSLHEYGTKLEAVKRWLQKTKRVSYTDDEDNYYNVKKVTITARRKHGFYCHLTVVFTCEPFVYLKAGDHETEIGTRKLLMNAYSWAQPLYRIVGSGLCEISVNGKSVTADVSQNLTIDTALMIAYKKDGTAQNTVVTGNYEDLYLQEEENVVTVTKGFRVYVTPRWRCL